MGVSSILPASRAWWYSSGISLSVEKRSDLGVSRQKVDSRSLCNDSENACPARSNKSNLVLKAQRQYATWSDLKGNVMQAELKSERFKLRVVEYCSALEMSKGKI